MRVSVVLAMVLAGSATKAQWVMQESGVTASLRGIDNVGGGVAWASGSEGTVLRTVDSGKVWQKCAVPPGAEKLDFRGVQAFDAKTAIVMSSGPGDASRLYKTVDGCGTWKLVFTNPDKEGFFDAIRFVAGDELVLLGDSVHGKRKVWECSPEDDCSLHEMVPSVPLADDGESSFAASNSVLELPVFPMLDASPHFDIRWASGTASHAYIYLRNSCQCAKASKLIRVAIPVRTGSASAGIFSFGFRNATTGVAVGGDFEHPDQGKDSAVYSKDGGLTWKAALLQPNGYRSAVAYERPHKTWIAVGTNGTDVSTDDGKNWRALRPSSADAADADKNWNALSLPFVVGSKGRIGILRDGAVRAWKRVPRASP